MNHSFFSAAFRSVRISSSGILLYCSFCLLPHYCLALFCGELITDISCVIFRTFILARTPLFFVSTFETTKLRFGSRWQHLKSCEGNFSSFFQSCRAYNQITHRQEYTVDTDLSYSYFYHW